MRIHYMVCVHCPHRFTARMFADDPAPEVVSQCSFPGCRTALRNDEIHVYDDGAGPAHYCDLHFSQVTDRKGSPYGFGTMIAVYDAGAEYVGQVIAQEHGLLTALLIRPKEPPSYVGLAYNPATKLWWAAETPLREIPYEQKKYEMLPIRGLLGKCRRRKLRAHTVRVARMTPKQYEQFILLTEAWNV